MMNEAPNPDANHLNAAETRRLFDSAKIIDSDWMHVEVTTSEGEKVHYRVPRKTLAQSTRR
jgi:hypothetical protein